MAVDAVAACCGVLWRFVARLVRLSHGAGPQSGSCVVHHVEMRVGGRFSEDVCVPSGDVSDLWDARAATAPPTRCRWRDAA